MTDSNEMGDEHNLGLSGHLNNLELGVGELIELNNASLKNLSCLRQYPQVKKVKIIHSVIENLDIFNECTFNNLVKLNLSHNQITSKLLDKLQVPGLIRLNLSSNKISSLNFLQSLTKLESLNISNNRISSLDELENLQANKMLKKLNLTLNPIVYDQEYLNILGNNLRFSFQLQKIFTFDTENDDLHFLQQIKIKQKVMELKTKNEAEKVNQLIEGVLNSPHTTNLNKNKASLEPYTEQLQTNQNLGQSYNIQSQGAQYIKSSKQLSASENFALLKSEQQPINTKNGYSSPKEQKQSQISNSEFHGEVGEQPINLSEAEMAGLMDSVKMQQKLNRSKREENPEILTTSSTISTQEINASSSKIAQNNSDDVKLQTSKLQITQTVDLEISKSTLPKISAVNDSQVQNENQADQTSKSIQKNEMLVQKQEQFMQSKQSDRDASEELEEVSEKEPLVEQNDYDEEINKDEEIEENEESKISIQSSQKQETLINGVPMKLLMSQKLEERFSQIDSTSKPSSDDVFTEQKEELKESMIRSFNNSQGDNQQAQNNDKQDIDVTLSQKAQQSQIKNSQINKSNADKYQSVKQSEVSDSVQNTQSGSIKSQIDALKAISDAQTYSFKGSDTDINFIHEQMNLEGLDDSKDTISLELEENLRKAREILFGNQSKSIQGSKLCKSLQAKSMQKSELLKSDLKGTKSIRFEDDILDGEIQKQKQEDMELRRSKLAELVGSVSEKPYKSQFMAKIYLMEENQRLLDELNTLRSDNAIYQLYQHIGLQNVDQDVLHGALLIQVEQERKLAEQQNNKEDVQNQNLDSKKVDMSNTSVSQLVKQQLLSQADLQYTGNINDQDTQINKAQQLSTYSQNNEISLTSSHQQQQLPKSCDKSIKGIQQEDKEQNSSTEDFVSSNVFKQFQNKSNLIDHEEQNNTQKPQQIELEPQNVQNHDIDNVKSKLLASSRISKIDEMRESLKEQENQPIIRRTKGANDQSKICMSQPMSQNNSLCKSGAKQEVGQLLRSYQMQKDEISNSLSKTRSADENKKSFVSALDSQISNNEKHEEEVQEDEDVNNPQEKSQNDLGSLLDHLNNVIMDQQNVINEQQQKLKRYRNKLTQLNSKNNKQTDISQSLGFSSKITEKNDDNDLNNNNIYQQNPPTVLSVTDTKPSGKCTFYSYEDAVTQEVKPKQDDNPLTQSVIHTEEKNTQENMSSNVDNVIIQSLGSDRVIGQLSTCNEQFGQISSLQKSVKNQETEQNVMNNVVLLKTQNSNEIPKVKEQKADQVLVLNRPIQVSKVTGRIPANFASSTVDHIEVNQVFAHPKSVISQHFQEKQENYDKSPSPTFSNIILVKSASRSPSKQIVQNSHQNEKKILQNNEINNNNDDNFEEIKKEGNRMQNIMQNINVNSKSPKSSGQSLAKLFSQKSQNCSNLQLQPLNDAPFKFGIFEEKSQTPKFMPAQLQRSDSAKRPSIAKSPIINGLPKMKMIEKQESKNMFKSQIIQKEQIVEKAKDQKTQNIQNTTTQNYQQNKIEQEKQQRENQLIVKSEKPEQSNDQITKEMLTLHEKILQYMQQKEEEHTKTKEELLDWKIRFSEAFIVVMVHIIFTIYMLFYKSIVMFFKTNKRDK